MKNLLAGAIGDALTMPPIFIPTREGPGVRRYAHGQRTTGSHVTAKTHRTIPCTREIADNIDFQVARLQMLKDRKERRLARG